MDTIKVRYEIVYQGKRQILHLTKSGAEAHAYRLEREKGWKKEDVKVTAVMI